MIMINAPKSNDLPKCSYRTIVSAQIQNNRERGAQYPVGAVDILNNTTRGIQMTTQEFEMNTMSDVIKTILDRYASELPWGIYFYDPEKKGLAHFGQLSDSEKHRNTELYLSTTLKDVCSMARSYGRTYTETSPSGMVYIAVPLITNQKTWAILATYLATGKVGSWRRSLNRGPSVSDSVDLLKEIGTVLNTYQQMQEWVSTDQGEMVTSSPSQSDVKLPIGEIPSFIEKD